MREINSLTVKYHNRIVGILAETKDGKGAFQYNKEWILDGFSISPFSLPLSERVYIPKKMCLRVCLVYLRIVYQMVGAVCW